MARKSRFDVVSKPILVVEEECLCGIYSRLSVEDGDDEEQNSIGNQKKIVLDFLKDHPKIKVVGFYSDNGYTGMNYNRPDFKRMMQDLRDGIINCVIIKDISRLGRHFIFTSEYVESIFPEMQVRLISVNDDYDSADETSDATALTLPLKMVMNDYYVKDISRKIRSSITAKMDEGSFLPSAGSIVYGYIRNPAENTFDIDKAAASVVKRIFTLKAARNSINEICKILNQEGIPSPGKLRYIRGITTNPKYENAIWVRKTVRKILSDVVYLGCRVHGRVKRDKIGLNKYRRDESEWMIIPNAHSAIITQELFNQVQQIIAEEEKERANFNTRAAIENDTREIFREKLFCAECGARLMGGKGTQRVTSKLPSYVYYNCRRYIDSRHLQCSNHHINQSVILETIEGVIKQQVRMALDMERLIADIKTSPELPGHLSYSEKKLAEIRAKRNNMEAKIEQLLLDLTERIIDRQEYVKMKEKYSARYEELLSEESRLFGEIKKLDMALASSSKWIQALKQYHKVPVIDRAIVELLIDKIYITENRDIKVILNYADPYKELRDHLREIEVIKDAV